MARIRSFAPLLGEQPTKLVLGSMPGLASLAASQYYAHPRNTFWPIMGELFGAHRQLAYEQRVDRLTGAGIAVWDVLGECVRPGSLDSEIQREGRVANDFLRFLQDNPGITAIYFNGGMAAELFRRIVLPTLGEQRAILQQLPSTSPANARMRLADKLAAWRVVGVQ